MIDFISKRMLIKIGILSDTHGLLRPEAISAISGSDLIVHAGDIGDPSLLESLAQIAPVHAVKGNMDKGSWAETLPLTDAFEVQGHFFYVLHELEHLDLAPAAAKFEMVISGHSHRPHLIKKDSVLYLNPGSAGPRRFTLPVTVARVMVKANGFYPEIVELDV